MGLILTRQSGNDVGCQKLDQRFHALILGESARIDRTQRGLFGQHPVGQHPLEFLSGEPLPAQELRQNPDAETGSAAQRAAAL